jgi:hypothetical protein
MEQNQVVTQLSPDVWNPPVHYESYDIAAITPGPAPVTFRGRIVNFQDFGAVEKMPRTANGCLRIMVRDDTGTITVSRNIAVKP